MSHALLLPSDQDIIAAVRQDKHDKKQQTTSYVENGFPLLQHGQPIAWVKSGGDELVDEAATQTYIHERFIQEPSLSDRLRVPKIYRVILCDDYPHTIVVMEYVHGRTVQQWLEISTERQDIFWGRILDAMKVLLALQPPGPITPPGPAGGGRIVHLVFGEYSQTESAPKDFDSVADLQNHVNQTIDNGNFMADFINEDFRLCQCDPNQRNFMLADSEGGGPMYMLDFGWCMWLPVSFLKWALLDNVRDDIFPWLEENLEQLRPPYCLEIHQRILSVYNYWKIRKERTSRNAP